MSYTPTGQLGSVPKAKKGIPTSEKCMVCHKVMMSGQLHTGVHRSDAPAFNEDGARVSDDGYYEGHYLCVVQALGPEEAMKAMQEGRLPMINPTLLVNGCLPVEHGGV